jgi:plastocyanin
MIRLRCLRQLPPSPRLRRTGRRSRLPLAAALIATALVVWAPGSEGLGQAAGRVSGNVKLTLANSAPSSASAYERRSVGPRPKPQPELKNVVIFFTDLPAARMAPMQASIAQKDEQFAPHLVAVTAGSSVAFPNEDPFFHNVFSLSRGAAFNLGRYPSGSSRSKTFARPGIVKVFCEIHSHMSAVVRVFAHGWFTVPNEDGTFAIDNVPPGTHAIVAWHERIGERRDRVTIRAGAATAINFTLPVLESGQ